MASLIKSICIFLFVIMFIQLSFQQDDEEPGDGGEEPEGGDGAGDAEGGNNEIGNGDKSGDEKASECIQWQDDEGKIVRDCFPQHMDPFHKANLRERLQYVVPHLPEQFKDPRFPWHVELHNRHLLRPFKPILPISDQNFIKLHYDSRGDILPQTKRIEERPGPMYTFQGQMAPCDPQYTFEKWFQLADDLRPPKRPGFPNKPYTPYVPCIRE